MSKRLSKYIASFDYFDCLSATIGRISTTSFATVTEAPVGVASASFSFPFSVTTGIVKNC